MSPDYAEITEAISEYLADAILDVEDYIRRELSPLRALCVDYDEQSFDVRIESEAAWKERDQHKRSYHVLVGDKWERLSQAEVLSGIRAGRFGAQTICRRKLYREFSLARFFPAEFGKSEAVAHDWNWEYAVGEFDTAGTMSDRLFGLLEAYWLDLMEREPDAWALPGTASGDGECYTYVRAHTDKSFTDAIRTGIRSNEARIFAIPHTDDFIVFFSVVESDFIPELIVLGDRRRFE